MIDTPQSRPSWLEQHPAGYKVHPIADGFAWIHESVKLSTTLTMGRFSYINAGGVLGGKYPIRIGAFCSIAAELYAWTWESHDADHATTLPIRLMLGVPTQYPAIVEKPQGISVGNDVYLGHQVRLMPGVTIGDGVVVAARAVVTRDLEPYGIYGGVPAKLIRKRFTQSVIDALGQIRFWEWPLDKIRRNAAFFDLKLSELESAEAIWASLVD